VQPRLPNVPKAAKACDNMIFMIDHKANIAATHFGRQMRKERTAHGWTLRELADRTGIDFGNLSKVENGRRPPWPRLAEACDRVFPERRGWFTDWYDESRQWGEVPPAFRSWAEVEERAASLRVWTPSVVPGLLQTEDYARTMLATHPKVTSAEVSARLASRMERQRRVLERDQPPAAWFIIDELALYRCVGSHEVMTAQCKHLLSVAGRPGITLTVMPAVAHTGTESAFVIADGSAYAEHAAGGYVFTDEVTVTSLSARFDSLRAEGYRASESAARIGRMAETWTALGGNPATAVQVAGTA
jgi:transcriptional regulator with XRE-family HTH domain